MLSELKHLRSNTKGKLFLLCFRTSNFFSKNKVLKVVGFPVRILYTLLFNYLLGIDIPDTLSVGKALNVYHGQGLVINQSVKIGDYVTLRHNTTIGNAIENGGCPILEDYVEVGANVVIIGSIRIGERAKIAAGSVVIKDVPPYTLVAGNPAVVKKILI